MERQTDKALSVGQASMPSAEITFSGDVPVKKSPPSSPQMPKWGNITNAEELEHMFWEEEAMLARAHMAAPQMSTTDCAKGRARERSDSPIDFQALEHQLQELEQVEEELLLLRPSIPTCTLVFIAPTGTRQRREEEDVMMPLESDECNSKMSPSFAFLKSAELESKALARIPRKGGMPRTGSYDNLTQGKRQRDLKSRALLGDEEGECLSLESLSRSSSVNSMTSAVGSHDSDVLLEASTHCMQEAGMSDTAPFTT